MLRHLLVLVAATVVVLAAAVSPAAASERWASATGDPGETVCMVFSPCTFENAVDGAIAGDVVRVMAGSYPVGSMTIAKAIEVRGEGANPPTLSGTSGAATIVADGGLRLTNLKITGTAGDALTLQGAASGDRLILDSQTGEGAKLVADAGTTMLKNSLVTSGGGSGTAAVRFSDNGSTPGSIEVRNVTAYSTGAGSGARCETAVSTTTIVNSLFRGDAADVDSTGTGSKCSAANSNLRLFQSLGTMVTTALQQQDPGLDGDYRPTADSKVVDAGTDAAANGTLDLAGATRVRGMRTDIGAYELQSDATAPDARPDATPDSNATGNPGPTTNPTAPRATPADEPQAPGKSPLAPAAPPQLGKSVLLDQAGTGTVLVKLPGTKRFIALSDAASLPVGTTIDTRKGAVTLSSALPGGKAQTGTFRGGLFEVRQSKSGRGMTDILLRGAYTKTCAKKTVARAAAAKKKRKKSSTRRLWASDKGGRFRTHGTNSVATVRGTKWLTEDRCDGTYTKVVEGAVDVRNKRTGKVKRVKAGRSVLVGRR